MLQKKGLDRRLHKRFLIEGKAGLQILGASGDPVGKPFRGMIADISASGLACLIKLIQKEIGQLLLGRSLMMKLGLSVKGTIRNTEQIGTVVAVSSTPFDDYCLHIKFHKMLDIALVRELSSAHAEKAS